MKVLIVGGVAGGATAAARLRRLDEAAEIIIFERGEYISFANCGLPYYVGGTIARREALTLQTPESFRRRFNLDVRVRQEVVSIDPTAKSVTVRRIDEGSSYEESYDKLILSPGAEPVRPDLPGIDSPRVFTLRNIPDALRLRRLLTEEGAQTAIIVGGGYIGIEMAENLTQAGLKVTVIERTDHILAPLDYEMACGVQNYLRGQGVNLLLQTEVQGFTDTADGIMAHLAAADLRADFVLLSAGVNPETGLAAAAGLTMGLRGSIVVDPHMLTSDPHIYAVGDAVQVADFVTGQPVLIPLAGPANKQGRIAADNIAGLASAYHGTQGSAVLKVFDMTAATTGINEQTARTAGLNYDKVYTHPASHATYYPGFSNMTLKVIFATDSGRILGAQIVGFDGVDKRCDVLATAIRAGMTAADLTALELCYAPPFSSAKDPVNMAGYIIENLLAGRIKQYHWDQVDALPRDGSLNLIDTRPPALLHKAGSIAGFKNIPLDELRARVAEIDQNKPVWLHCQTALTSYIAHRILTQLGFDCRHLAGGYQLYAAVKNSRAFDAAPFYACGVKA